MNPLQPLALIYADRRLAMVVAGVFLNGATAASIGPFTSLLAIDVFGLTNAALSAVLAVASVVGVSAAISVGIVTDQRANRRRVGGGSADARSAAPALLVLAGNSAAGLRAGPCADPAGRRGRCTARFSRWRGLPPRSMARRPRRHHRRWSAPPSRCPS